MNRKAKVLQHLDKNGIGIEIGPGLKPIAPKRAGFKVEIIDYLSREQLIAKYKDEHTNLEEIEEVDYVWHGESYAELTGKTKFYDWIIASHVIEHTADLIDFLNNCGGLLNILVNRYDLLREFLVFLLTLKRFSSNFNENFKKLQF